MRLPRATGYTFSSIIVSRMWAQASLSNHRKQSTSLHVPAHLAEACHQHAPLNMKNQEKCHHQPSNGPQLSPSTHRDKNLVKLHYQKFFQNLNQPNYQWRQRQFKLAQFGVLKHTTCLNLQGSQVPLSYFKGNDVQFSVVPIEILIV